MRGIAIVGSGVIVVSTEGLLIKLISMDAMAVLFWRGIGAALVLASFLLVRYRRQFVRCLTAMNRNDWLAAVLFAGSSIAFVISIKHTLVANTLIIVSTTPMLAAVLSVVCLRERFHPSIWLTVVGVMTGTIIVFWGSVESAVLGDIAAFVSALFLAGQFVVLRAQRRTISSRDNVTPSLLLSSVMITLLVAPFADPLPVPADDAVWLGLMGLVVVPLAFSLIFIGPTYLSAPEVGLVMLLEAVFGPIWAWLALGEVPGGATVGGGALILGCLAAYSLWTWTNEARHHRLREHGRN